MQYSKRQPILNVLSENVKVLSVLHVDTATAQPLDLDVVLSVLHCNDQWACNSLIKCPREYPLETIRKLVICKPLEKHVLLTIW